MQAIGSLVRSNEAKTVFWVFARQFACLPIDRVLARYVVSYQTDLYRRSCLVCFDRQLLDADLEG